jgi:hypothetical protein
MESEMIFHKYKRLNVQGTITEAKELMKRYSLCPVKVEIPSTIFNFNCSLLS